MSIVICLLTIPHHQDPMIQVGAGAGLVMVDSGLVEVEGWSAGVNTN